MNSESLLKLEYPRIQQEVLEQAVTYAGKERVTQMAPFTDLNAAVRAMAETAEAKRIVDRSSGLPLPTLAGIEQPLSMFGKGYILTADELWHLAQFLRSCGHWKQFLLLREEVAPFICSYVRSIYDLTGIQQTLEQSLAYGQISDNASTTLHRIRRKIRQQEERIKKRLDELMSKYRSILQEALVSKRNGRFVIPVRKEFRKKLPGAVLDESASGQTVYIEPYELDTLQQELSSLQAEEAIEEIHIRSQLTDQIEAHAHEIKINVDTIGYYDFLFAKAKYALRTGASSVKLNDQGIIRLKQAVHPFLTGQAVPLDVTIGEDFHSLIITGPNTGGKTVLLKTIGLLTLMAQSGLLVPAHPDSELAVFQTVEADIGDNQSIDESLSTFSAHVRTIIRMLEGAGPRTLILLDELAAGTDPGEGIGLSIAILEELAARKATVIATTHFNEIKRFAEMTSGFENARMEFNLDTLRPLYRLTIGVAGQSYALHIASRLGIRPAVIERARILAGNRPADVHLPEPDGKAELQLQADRREAAPSSGKAVHSRKQTESTPTPAKPWEVGDRVFIPSLKRSGVVYRTADERGNLIVQVQHEKLAINTKRLKPFIDRKQLYPDNYDMAIVFETKENRKKRKQMAKHHVEGLTIETKPDEQEGKSWK